MTSYQSPDKHFKIRIAERKDSELIYTFIKKLAAYEKLQHVMTSTVLKIEKSLFDLHQAEVIIAYNDDKPIGFALYFYTYSTFLGKANLYLEDLFIDEEYRGQGFGKRMFSFLAKLAIKKECERLDFMCLTWNEPSIHFYKRLGAIPLDDWITFRLNKDALKKLADQR